MPPAPILIDLSSANYWVDPYPTLRAARAAGRTTVTNGGEIVLLNADDVDTLYLDPHFTVPGVSDLARIGITDGPFYEWRKQTLAVKTGKEHARLRAFVGPAFSPGQHNLTMRCTAKINALTIQMTPALGTTTSIAANGSRPRSPRSMTMSPK